MANPKIITLTVTRMRNLATEIDADDDAGTMGTYSASLRKWATELDEYDARETRLDPSERPHK